MAVKKRKLSPSASSQSSTPAPPISHSAHPPSSPVPSEHPADSTPGAGAPASQSLALSRTQGKARITDVRPTAKPGIIQPGSGDGTGCGDECYIWQDLPMNKNAYRYVPCGPSPNPSPADYHEFYRILPPSPPTPPVHISWLDRSHFLRLSPDALTATTDRGYRSGRASVSVREGTWYFEAEVLRGNGQAGASKGSGGEGGNAHVRVGWGRREAGLDAPVGADGFAYGLSDVRGDKVHVSRPLTYARNVQALGGRGFGTGDVVGCLISLPKRPTIHPKDKPSVGTVGHRRRFPMRYKGQNYFEMDEYLVPKEMEALVDRDGKFAQARLDAELAQAAANGEGGDKDLGPAGGGAKGKKTKNTKKGKAAEMKKRPEPVVNRPVFRDLERIPGSRIEFFVNGQSLGNAFEDIYDYLPLPPLPHPDSKKSSEKEEMPDDGTLGYYPMISCFGRGKLRMNFGPEFRHPPPEGARAMCERWGEYVEEERELDEKEEREMRVQLEVDVENERRRTEVLEAKLAKKAAAAAAKMGKKAGVGGSPLSGNSKGRKGTGTPTPSVPSRLAQTAGPEEAHGGLAQPGVSVDTSGSVNGDVDMESTAGDRAKLDLSSSAGSTPASPTPGFDSAAPLAAVTKGKSKKGKVKPKAKAGGKGKSKLNTGASESSRDTSLAPATNGAKVGPTVGPVGIGHGPGQVAVEAVGNGEEGGDEDAEGEEDVDMDAEGEIDAEGETDAEGEVDEEYEGVSAPAVRWGPAPGLDGRTGGRGTSDDSQEGIDWGML